MSENKNPTVGNPFNLEPVVLVFTNALQNLIWAASERDKGNRIRQFDEFIDEARCLIVGGVVAHWPDGTLRDPRDIASDPSGKLIHTPGQILRASQPSTQHKDHLTAEQIDAAKEGERNAAADQYFSARTWVLDTPENRRIYEAGFDAAFQKAHK